MYTIIVSGKDNYQAICYGLGGREPAIYKTRQQADEERDRMEIDFQDYPEQPTYKVYQLHEVA